jgi:hypothetical protein
MCRRYYTKQDDGLSKKWGERNWMNPPYGREIGEWVKKAARIRSLSVFSPLALIHSGSTTPRQSRNQIHQGTVEVRRIKKLRSISINVCNIPSTQAIQQHAAGRLST